MYVAILFFFETLFYTFSRQKGVINVFLSPKRWLI